MTVPPQDPLAEDAEIRSIPSSLWERLRADPARAPENLALAAAERHAPAAEAWLEEKRRMYAMTPAELALAAKRRHAALARFSGAATGVGGFVTIVPDLAAAAWVQSRCVFFIAAAYGFDPRDPMRPAELLHLQGVYDSVEEARAALDGTGTHLAQAMVSSRLGSDEALAPRLARMVGKRAIKRVGARLIPGLAIALNAVGNERDTRALADRAIRFYGG
jgi:hypothetical protein